MVEVMKIKLISFKRSHARTAPNLAAGHYWPTPPPETPGLSQGSLGQSLVGSLLLSPGSWCTQGFVCAIEESVSPVLCKFWQLYGGASGNLLQEGLCHTQVCCTQSPCPYGRALLTCTSSVGTQTQFCPSLCGISGPDVHKVCLSPLSVSLASMGFDSKCDFNLIAILLRLLLYPWTWSIFFGRIQHSPFNGCSAVSCGFLARH